jgi:excisionase family DNA binding protein
MENENSNVEQTNVSEKIVILREIRLSEKPTLTVQEAAALYNIGENKIRELSEKDSCPFVIFVGRKRLIKRKQFEDYIGKTYSI